MIISLSLCKREIRVSSFKRINYILIYVIPQYSQTFASSQNPATKKEFPSLKTFQFNRILIQPFTERNGTGFVIPV